MTLVSTMRWLTVQAILATMMCSANAVEPADEAYGSEPRVLWTQSRIVGFPDPPPPFEVTPAFSKIRFAKPLGVVAVPGTNDLLVMEHQGGYGGPGRLLKFSDNDSSTSLSEFLELKDIIYGVAFHPDFVNNGYLYLGCNGQSEALGAKATRVLRFRVSRVRPFACDRASQVTIIEWPSDGHNGGDLVFGNDGMLYVSAGDGTSDSDAKHTGQDLTTITGSIIRIDVDHPDQDRQYAVPADNPFINVKDARPEIWAYGLRNPWRISFDKQRGHLWAGNNGQDLWETVHLIRRGENYGWSVMEGSHPFQPNRQHGPTPIIPPTIEHPHSQARSLTGGHVYDGSRLPGLQGHYVYGDYSTGMIWAAKYRGSKVVSHKVVARTSLQISGFGLDHSGELLIVDHGGGLYRLQPNPQKAGTNFPRLLSETGIFESVARHQVLPGLIPYSVNAPLWSDGAEKERFIGLPDDRTIDFKGSNGWDFPDGSVLVKTFALPLAQGDTKLTRIETRLMNKQDGEWYGYSYRWNQDQTDAVLVGNPGEHGEFIVRDARAPQGKRPQTWYFPSRADCMVCHSRAANFVLGLSVLQTNLITNEPSPQSQLDHFRHLGIFAAPTTDSSQGDNRSGQAFTFQTPPDKMPRLVNPGDKTQPLQRRVRSYLHANCAHCHVNAGGGNSQINLAFDTSLEKTRLVDAAPLHGSSAVADARLVAPGSPEKSILLHRLRQRGPGRMPPLASSVVDDEAVELITNWINQLPPATAESAQNP